MKKGQLNKENKTLYNQLKDSILKKYENLSYFSSLPSERELCKEFGISRSTVRKGMDMLEAEGKIVRMQGKGAFYIGDKSNNFHKIHNGIGFYNDELKQGKIIKSKVLLQNVENASKEIAEKLGISPNDAIFHLFRLRFIDNKALSLTESFIPMYICPELTKFDFTAKSLYNSFREYGIEPNPEYQALEVRPATTIQAMHLEIKPGDPLLIAFTLTYDNDGRIIEYVTTIVAAYKTRFEFNKQLPRPGHN
jgi:GntR family transcriptional regulator